MKAQFFLKKSLILIALLAVPIFTTAQDTSYTKLIDTTIAGRKLYQLQVVQVGSNGFQKVETTPRIDSATLVGQLYFGAKEAKNTLRNPMRVIANQTQHNRVFANNNALLQQITGKSYFDFLDTYGADLVNDPKVDTVFTKLINGAPFTSYIVFVNGTRTFCRVNASGVFQEIPSATSFTATTNGKRGRLLLYDNDFGRFTGVGDYKLTDDVVDVVLVGKIVDENNQPVRELWSSADGSVRLLKNLPR